VSNLTIAVRIGRLGRINDYAEMEKISADDMAFWEQAKGIVGSWCYVSKGSKVTVECDFSPIVKAHEENINWVGAVLDESPLAHSMTAEILDFSTEFFINVTVESEDGLAESNLRCDYYAEKYLYDLFFVMNVSRPGVCDFLGVQFDSGSGFVTKVRLSSDCFESSFYKTLEGGKVAPGFVPLDKVVAWYRKLDMGLSQIAGLGVEKAIFSILHICRGSDVDIVWVIWAFHALEAVYGTKVGEGFKNLIDRISFLLQLDERDKKYLKKNLREMYDLRSAFVHGGYKAHHPMMNEVIDERLNGECAKLLIAMQFGFDLVVASLQALIINEWYGVKVEESISGALYSDVS